MKKTITILAILATLMLAGCGQKNNPQDFLSEQESVGGTISVPTIDLDADTNKEESVEESAEEIPSPIDFEFKVNEEINTEEIIKHAHELGLFENTWNAPMEIKGDDIINSYGLKYKSKWEAFSVDEVTNSTSVIVEIPQADIDDMIGLFVAMPADNLHKAEKYDVDLKTYQFLIELKTVASEETEVVWPIKAGEIKVVIENIYEITLIDITDESAPADFGVLTVEDNQSVPWYMSFIKAAGADGSEASSPGSSSTGGGNQTDSSTSTGSGTSSTSSTTGENTSSSDSTGSSEPGSMWDGVDLPPDDPNSPNVIIEDHSDYPWS